MSITFSSSVKTSISCPGIDTFDDAIGSIIVVRTGDEIKYLITVIITTMRMQ